MFVEIQDALEIRVPPLLLYINWIFFSFLFFTLCRLLRSFTRQSNNTLCRWRLLFCIGTKALHSWNLASRTHHTTIWRHGLRHKRPRSQEGKSLSIHNSTYYLSQTGGGLRVLDVLLEDYYRIHLQLLLQQ